MHKHKSSAYSATLQCLIILSAFFLAIAPVDAAERVENLTTKITLAANGEALVEHKIVVFSEGDQIKRGIYFKIPSAIGPISKPRVLRNGAAEPYSLDGRDIRIGNANVFIKNGRHEYSIRYTAATPFVAGADGTIKFSWAPLIAQFELPWTETQVELRWPADHAALNVDAPGATIADGSVICRSTKVDSRDPADFKVIWAADTFPEQSIRPRPYNPWLRYGAILAALAVFFYFHSQWQAHGKDLPAGAALPRSKTPRGISAGAARFISRMSYDAPCFVAALASLAVKGAVTISLEKKTQLQLKKLSDNETTLSPGELALKKALFAKGDPAVLSPSNSLVAKGMASHKIALRAEFGERFFTENKDSWMRGFLGALAAIAVLLVFIITDARSVSTDPVASVIGLAALMILFMTPLIYYSLMRAPTVAGRMIMDEIEGLKLHLSDDAPLPSASGDDFIELLPFAIALDVEKEWAARFGDSLPAAADSAAQAIIDWYNEMQRHNDGAALVTVFLPAIVATSSGGTAGAAGGGASAGGW